MKRKAFILPVIALFLTQGLMQANMTDMIVFVNYTQPENAVISGYAISIMYLGMSIGSVILGPLADRFEPKFILTGSLFAVFYRNIFRYPAGSFSWTAGVWIRRKRRSIP